jgi:hypothetical protein
MASILSSERDRSEQEALIKWGWVAYGKRQKEDDHKFWYNAYWKTELAK